MEQKGKSFFQRFKKTILGLGIFLLLMLAFAYWLGFSHVPGHVRDLWNEIHYQVFEKHEPVDSALLAQSEAAMETADTTDVAVSAAVVPTDTTRWSQWKPEDIPEQVKQGIAEYKKRDFSKLRVATDAPTDQQVQDALVRRYGDEVINLLKSHHAHMRRGTCYVAPLQPRSDDNKEIARVTCMVTAFNEQGDNLMNISQPIDIIYDFIQVDGDPGTWYITDFSQSIPYDYKLNK